MTGQLTPSLTKVYPQITPNCRKKEEHALWEAGGLSCNIHLGAMSSYIFIFHLDQRSKGNQSATIEKNEAVRQRGAEKEGPKGLQFQVPVLSWNWSADRRCDP